MGIKVGVPVINTKSYMINADEEPGLRLMQIDLYRWMKGFE